MGCCASQRQIIGSQQKAGPRRARIFKQPAKIEKIIVPASDNVTVSQRQQRQKFEQVEFTQYIEQIKSIYKIQNYKLIWFNKGQQIQPQATYLLQTDGYDIKCVITEVDKEKAHNLQFTLICPETHSQLEQGILKNLLFVYCKQRRQNQLQEIIPIMVKIQKNEAQIQEGIFNFIVNINFIIKMNMQLVSRQANS